VYEVGLLVGELATSQTAGCLREKGVYISHVCWTFIDCDS